jgi:signal transduction histidine kinase/ActR/RegA family two-component response regulator
MNNVPDCLSIAEQLPALKPLLDEYSWKFGTADNSFYCSSSLLTYLGEGEAIPPLGLSELKSFIHHQDHELFETMWDTARHNGSVNTTLRLVRRDGSIDHVLFRGERFPGAKNEIIGSCRNLTLIQEGVREMLALVDHSCARVDADTHSLCKCMPFHEYVHLIHQVLEQSGYGITFTDHEGIIRNVNTFEAERIGRTRQDLVGTTAAVLQTDEHGSPLFPEFRNAFDQGVPFRGKVETRRPHDSTKVELVYLLPLRDRHNVITHYYIRRKDITAEFMNDKRRDQSRNLEALGTLAGGIAHNFNNLLMGIMGFTEMTQLELADDHPCQRYLEKVLASTQQGKELVEQIMTFSGQAARVKKPLRIGIIIKEILKSFQVLLPPNITLNYSIKDMGKMLIAEPCQSYQIVTNLLDNALSALGTAKGSIDMQLAIVGPDNLPDIFPDHLPRGEYFCLRIDDTGPGMDRETVKRVFEPFFIAGPNFRQKTGMGLPIVHAIVKDLQGSITVESQKDKGTRVHIHLPTSTTIGQRVQTEQRASHRGYGHILFIDDQPVIIDWARQSLTTLGYTITATTRSREGLAWLKEDPSRFDLVITDLVMPDMDGLEIITTINEIAPNIPVILCSGHDSKTLVEASQGVRVAGMLSKPFTMAEVSKMIATVLKERAYTLCGEG